MTERMTFAEAALCLRQTYHQVRAMVLRGELAGGKDERDRWFAETAAVRRLARRHRKPLRNARTEGRPHGH